MERELLMTGIGGQGVQLAAQLIAKTATRCGRYAQLFGSYGGMMRGGNTDATLIIGDEPVQAPPMVGIGLVGDRHAPRVRAADAGAAAARRRPGAEHERRARPTATPRRCRRASTASRSRRPSSRSSSARPPPRRMVALGAYAAVTRILAIEELVRHACPRRCRATAASTSASNARALQAGAEAAAGYGILRPGLAAARREAAS